MCYVTFTWVTQPEWAKGEVKRPQTSGMFYSVGMEEEDRHALSSQSVSLFCQDKGCARLPVAY